MRDSRMHMEAFLLHLRRPILGNTNAAVVVAQTDDTCGETSNHGMRLPSRSNRRCNVRYVVFCARRGVSRSHAILQGQWHPVRLKQQPFSGDEALAASDSASQRCLF